MQMHDDNEIVINSFLRSMQALVAQPVWSVLVGPSTGSRLSIAAGGKRRRRMPLKSRHVSDVERELEGELGLYVECAWRLDSADGVVCGSGTAELDPDEIGRIKETTVERVEVARPAFDCALYLSGGLVLRLFCDEMDDGDNYSLFTADAIFTVASRSTLVQGPPPAW